MYVAALVLSLATFIAAAIYYVRHPAFSIYHPLTLYICFHGFLFVFRPILAWYEQFSAIYGYFMFTPSPADKLAVLLASNLGFIVFFVACLSAGHCPMQFKQDRFAIAERGHLRRIFPYVLAICLPIGGYSMYHFWSGVSSNEAFSGMALDRNTGIFISTAGNGYLLEAQTMLASATALIAWVYRFRLIALAPLAAFFLLRAGTGGRGPFIAAIGMAILLYFYEKRQRLPAARLALLGAFALAAFVFVGENRGAQFRKALGVEDQAHVSTLSDNEKFLEGMDFGNLEYFEYIVYAVPKLTGTYDYFLDNLQLFTEPIPRVLWISKPIGPPVQRFNLMDYGKPYGMTRSLPGEGWYAWGWLGVCLWCGLWGWAMGRIYRAFAEGPQNALQTAAYMVFLPILIVAFRDGSIVTIFREGIFYFFPLAVWFGISRSMGLPTARDMRFAAWCKWRRLKAEKLGEQALPFDPGLAAPSVPPGIPARRH